MRVSSPVLRALISPFLVANNRGYSSLGLSIRSMAWIASPRSKGSRLASKTPLLVRDESP